MNRVFNFKNTIYSNLYMMANTFYYNGMSATHSLNYKSMGQVAWISSKHLNNLDIYKKAYEIVLRSSYGNINKGYTNDKLKLEELMESIKG